MKRLPVPSIRLCALLLLLSLLWLMLGAPLLAEEWCALPARFQRTLRQTPLRMVVIFRQWFAASV